ncbi:alpha/beta hydrolase [Helicobacter sp. MIT 11-5569]|nr:alpha/beta hydrolase [Helicobacter sp. MIT 11-5569]
MGFSGSFLEAKENLQNADSEIPVANPSKEAMRNASKNPFGLVYDGAITHNEKGKVQIFPISYTSTANARLKIAANLYLPANFSENKKYKAIVVAHPNGGVKEQTAGLYAQKLAQMGFITLAFDAAFQGASEGLPRLVDKPSNRVNDIFEAVSFLSNHKNVESEGIGILGICGGGGYTVKAAQSDKRLKAVATLSLFNTGKVRRNGFLDSDIKGIQTRLSQASKAKSNEAKGEIAYTGAAPKALSPSELEKIPAGLYREGMVYYGDTHAHPNSSFAFTTSSLLDLMSFDATDRLELLNQPLLLLTGDKADTAYMSEEIFQKATGTQDKKLVKLNNATHIQTYYEPRIVNETLHALQDFYAKYL